MARMTDEEIERLLAEPQVGVLCTVDADRRPEGSPVWFEHQRGTVKILVHRNSRKARSIAANSHVSLTVDTRVVPYRGVILRGDASLSGPSPALRRELAHRYLGAETGERYLATTAYLDQEDALITMRVTSRYSWDYSKGF
jgi:nitroimidazol reductase NimA-like FMN-containing flavoprotein (pyridoxamine 5'-phosphate oxidase superfamily)